VSAPLQPRQSDSDDEPLVGWVLFLPDPYCWFKNPDVRRYLGNPSYAVRIGEEEPW